MLPGCLNFFQNIDGKCEHNIKAAKPIMLEWDDHAKGKEIKPKPFLQEAEEEEGEEGEAEAENDENQGEDEEESGITRSDTGTELDLAWEMFADEDDDLEGFYDFTEAIRVPDCTITFQNFRVLQNICLLPNKHLLIEGGTLEQIVEVY